MHVMITGGAGFIGSHIAKFYLEKGFEVTVIDSLTNGFEENVHPGVNFIFQDITEEGWIGRLPQNVDYVIHLAAQSSGEISFENPTYDVKTNTVSTLELLKWAHENSVEKFLFASSMNVYGNVPDEPIAEERVASPESFVLLSHQYFLTYLVRQKLVLCFLLDR